MIFSTFVLFLLSHQLKHSNIPEREREREREMAMSLAYCVKEQKPCVRWVEKYFKDCLCSLKDEFSFTFGLISLVCWGVAEIPQIITNFRTKSSHGVSLAFLLTWVAGSVIFSAQTHIRSSDSKSLFFYVKNSF